MGVEAAGWGVGGVGSCPGSRAGEGLASGLLLVAVSATVGGGWLWAGGTGPGRLLPRSLCGVGGCLPVGCRWLCLGWSRSVLHVRCANMQDRTAFSANAKVASYLPMCRQVGGHRCPSQAHSWDRDPDRLADESSPANVTAPQPDKQTRGTANEHQQRATQSVGQPNQSTTGASFSSQRQHSRPRNSSETHR